MVKVDIHYFTLNSKIKEINISLVDDNDSTADYFSQSTDSVGKLAKMIFCYLQGQPQNFKSKEILSMLDLPLSANAKKVLLTLNKIAPVKGTITYGELAKRSGLGKNYARAVGRIMSINPFPIVIPCHQVVGAGKKIGGFQGKSRSIDLKLKLLELFN
ncbi:MAG: MGMT family protein [Oligoflexia bacterium]|nr:MGMT family protein [Oligoflexia bacterium]